MEKGYRGRAPGQSLDAVLSRLTLRDLQDIVGDEVLPLLAPDRRSDKTSLIAATSTVLRSDPSRLASDRIRKLVLRNLDPGKDVELDERLGREGLAHSDLKTSAGRSVLAGFLGLKFDSEQRMVSAAAQDALEAQFGLFSHQRSVVRRAYSRIGAGHGRVVIHMPTGAGKTRTAMHYAARILNEVEPCTIVWLASGSELLEQAADAFQTAWSALGNRRVDLHRFWGSYDADPAVIEDGMVVGGFAKMHSWRHKHPVEAMRLGARTRLVIVDEAHQAIASTYRAVIEGMAEVGQYDAILGLTATPGRTWSDVSADEALAEFFQNAKVVLEIVVYDNPVEYLLKEGYLSRPRFSRIEYATPATNSVSSGAWPDASMVDYDQKVLDALARSEARNRAILDNVRSLIERGHRRIILFASSVSHSRLLSTALELQGTSAPVVTGETPMGQRSEVLRRFRGDDPNPTVLCNFGVLTTGFDAPSTSAAVIARPTRSLVLFSQMVGRATRGPKAGGNSESEILTVHDPSCPGFGDIVEAFYNWEDVWSE